MQVYDTVQWSLMLGHRKSDPVQKQSFTVACDSSRFAARGMAVEWNDSPRIDQILEIAEAVERNRARGRHVFPSRPRTLEKGKSPSMLRQWTKTS